MKKLSSQSGMTIVEMLIALAISAVILSSIGTALYIITNITGRGNAHAAAIQDLQRAAFWISHDGQMARTTDLIDGALPVASVTLSWLDADDVSHSSVYSLSGTELLRTYDGITTTVGMYISSVEFSLNDELLTYRIESTPPGRWAASRETIGVAHLRPFVGD